MPLKILITGASSGIGKKSAELLLEKGHLVVGVARNFDGNAQGNFYPIEMDLSKLVELPKFYLKLWEQFKGFDAIICNVGRGIFGNIEELSLHQMHAVMDLNFFSHVYLIKSLLSKLKSQNHADLLFIGSEAALLGKRKGSIYCASKFALRGFVQALRDECKSSNVRITMIQPGMVDTPFYDDLSFKPGENALSSEDIAKCIEMILSLRPGVICEEIFISPQKPSIAFKESVHLFSQIADNEN